MKTTDASSQRLLWLLQKWAEAQRNGFDAEAALFEAAANELDGLLVEEAASTAEDTLKGV